MGPLWTNFFEGYHLYDREWLAGENIFVEASNQKPLYTTVLSIT